MTTLVRSGLHIPPQTSRSSRIATLSVVEAFDTPKYCLLSGSVREQKYFDGLELAIPVE